MRDGRDGRDGKAGPRGFPGERGPSGDRGIDGRSAYEIAVSRGFTGSEREWLESLRGPSGGVGIPGQDGADGPPGSDGADGKDGTNGESAYELAVQGGFKGSERLWLLSLKGERGTKGDAGPRGSQGPVGPMPNHEWSGTELRFELPDGSWGQYVDLKGPTGKRGQDGLGGGASLNTYFPSGWM